MSCPLFCILFLILVSSTISFSYEPGKMYYLLEYGGKQNTSVIQQVFESDFPDWTQVIIEKPKNSKFFPWGLQMNAMCHFRWISTSDAFIYSFSDQKIHKSLDVSNSFQNIYSNPEFKYPPSNVFPYAGNEILNRFPYNSKGICTKEMLFKHIERLFSIHHIDTWDPCSNPPVKPNPLWSTIMDHVPPTFYPTRSESDMNAFLDYNNLLQDIVFDSKKHLPWPPLRNESMWIIKPSTGARGVGIQVVPNAIGVVNYLEEHPEKSFIVQKYIDNPLLIHNSKFDIRQFVYLTGLGPNTAWVNKDAYLRFTSEAYSNDNLDKFIHLTNAQVQKENPNWSSSESIDKVVVDKIPSFLQWPKETFELYFVSEYGQEQFDILWNKINNLILASISLWPTCSLDHLGNTKHHNRPKSFELLGFDIMVDSHFNPWLLEVNCNPGFHMLSPVVQKHHANAFRHMIKLVLDEECRDSLSNPICFQRHNQLYPIGPTRL